jgi:hypothetical protein
VRNSIRLVDEDAEHADFTAAQQLNIDHFQAARLRYPLCDFSNFFQTGCHRLFLTKKTAPCE